jgi:hypothetical protein
MKIQFKTTMKSRYFYFGSCLLNSTGYGYCIPSISFIVIDMISDIGMWREKEMVHIKGILKEINAKR